MNRTDVFSMARATGYGALVLLLATAGRAETKKAGFTVAPTKIGHEVRSPANKPVLQYMTGWPEGTQLTASSTCCLYPVVTPKGTRVIDFAPDDHKHHRGIFLAWHNIQGDPGGDFWGWGKFAPTAGRIILNKSAKPTKTSAGEAVLEIANEWLAGEHVLIEEALTVTTKQAKDSYLIDLNYVLTPMEELVLGQSAFGGFCVKSRKENGVYTDPDGVVKLPNPHHLKPETDWPAKPWYDYTFKLADGTQAGVTVIDHKDNPVTTWHNLPPIAMINPCIVAPGEVKLAKEKPLNLRYRLVVHDGPVPTEVVQGFARDFARE